MLRCTLCSTALALLVSASPTLAAQPGTSEEAQAIQKRVERYVGRAAFADRYVTIAPDAKGYRVAMDLSPLMSRLGDSGLTIELSPIEFRISRRTDGDWDVAGNQAMRARIVAPMGADGETIEVEGRTNDAPFEAVVADGTGTILSSTGTIGPMEMRQEDAASVKRSSFGISEYRARSLDSGPGLVDTTMTQTIASSREVVVLKPAADGPTDNGEPRADPFDFGPVTTTMGVTEINTSVSGMRAEAVQDLWALAIERLESDETDGDAFRQKLRIALRALGPIWNDVSAAYSVRDLKLETRIGSATLARFEQTMSSDGFVRASDHRITVAMEGLTVVSELVPPIARDFLPQSATLNFAATGVDLETPVRLLADHIDPELENFLPPETGQALVASFLAQPPRLVIEPSRIVGPGYEMTFDLVAHASGRGYRVLSNIAATGIDEVLSKLQATGTPEAFQAAGMLGFAKGFGRPEADGRTAWTIEKASDGSVKVNGVELVPAPASTRAP